MRSIAKKLAIALCSSVLASASLLAQDVNTDYNHTTPFDKIKTYNWAKVQASDPLAEPRITAAVDHVLVGQGLHINSKNPDILITAVDVANSAQYRSFYSQLTGYTWKADWENGNFSNGLASPSRIPAHTLVIDMYDPATHKLVWRGTASQAPESKERKTEDDIDKAVNIMFTRFPPKSGGPVAPNQMEAPADNSGAPVTGR